MQHAIANCEALQFVCMSRDAQAGAAADLALTDTFLSRAPLVDSSPSNYRNRMVYDLRQGEAALHGCELGLPSVREAGCVVARWAVEQSGMPVGYYREATVRTSSIGTLQVKLLVQTALPPAADTRWPQERGRLVAYLRQLLPLLRSLSMQVTPGKARPPKDVPCEQLWGESRLEQSRPRYHIGPESFCQVNHRTGGALFATVADWLRPGCASDDAAVTADTHVLVSGRDVNMFGVGLFRGGSSGSGGGGGSGCGRGSDEDAARLACARLSLVTHCPNAHADARVNLDSAGHVRIALALRVRSEPSDTGESRCCCQRVTVTAGLRLVPPLVGTATLAAKGAQTAAAMAATAVAPQAADAGADDASPPPPHPHPPPPPRVAIATAGRGGVGGVVCAQLVAMPSVRALVYVACCRESAVRDTAALLGGGGFCVAAARRFDHFPGTAHEGAALLLLRRPPSLLLPVGPAGSGKSTLCRALAAALPAGAARLIERDALFASRRAAGAGLARARREAADDLSAALRAAAAAGDVALVDSCNARRDGRHHYLQQLLQPDGGQAPMRRCMLLSMAPECIAASSADAVAAAAAATEYRAALLARVRQRAAGEGHPTFPGCDEAEAQERALDATLAAMEWPTEAEARALGARLLLVPPPQADASEGPSRAVLDAVFAAFFWPMAVAST